MTLIVGAPFPWPGLAKRLALPGASALRLQRGVILAADSRWTYELGEVEDGAVKLFGIGRSGLAVYAGSVTAGERALEEISLRLRRTSTLEEFADSVATILKEIWVKYSPKSDGLYVLIALSARNDCWLMKFSCEDGFSPHLLTDIEIIAPEEARRYFLQELQHAMDEITSDSLRTWSGVIARIVHDTSEKQVHSAVGGKILFGITSRGLAEGLSLVRLRFGGDTQKAEELTVQPETARTKREWWRYDPGGDPV